MPEPGGIDRAALTVNHWFWQAVDWVYPPVCISCGKSGERWCSSCQALVERVGVKYCSKCGKRNFKGILCQECKNHNPVYTALRSYGLYKDPMRQAILRVKYHRDLGLGEILADLLRQLLEEQGWQLDLVIPVPLSPAKLRERGYNQVELFARPLAWTLGLPYHDQILQRTREDTSQVNLSAEDRRKNVMKAFEVSDPHCLCGKRVLLVDDVATTGSTAEVCAGVMLKGGANSIYVATLARSLLRKPDQEVI
ncbi:MAG: ComF family protein [Anaerolineaceae bacterium]